MIVVDVVVSTVLFEVVNNVIYGLFFSGVSCVECGSYKECCGHFTL